MSPPRPALLACLLPLALWGPARAEPQALPLKPERVLLPPVTGQDGAAFIYAERLSGTEGKEALAEGAVEMRTRRETVFADWLRYDLEQNEVWAKGQVRMRHDRDFLSAPEIRYRRDTETGFARDARFRLSPRGQPALAPAPAAAAQTPAEALAQAQVRSRSPAEAFGRLESFGTAERIEFAGPERYLMTAGTYTTCRAERPDWFLRVGDLEIDQQRQVGSAHHATIVFQGVPMLYTPWLDFPLTNERKTGFLTPSFGSTGRRGLEMSLPWYWNIAPNYDATLTARLMTKRGLMMNGQFRYLQPQYAGEFDAEGILRDRPTNSDRYGLAWRHRQTLLPGLTASLNLNRVSDDSYFVDFADRISATSQTTLPREVALSYNLPWGGVVARVQRFQTLQDPAAPILPPYERAPQLLGNFFKADWLGLDLKLAAEYVRFRHPTQITGQRALLNPSIAYPMRRGGLFLTPRLQYHWTAYHLDPGTGLNQNVDVPVYADTRRQLPIASIDAGATLEREIRLFDLDLVQTLEPRIFYVKIPFREQTQIPVFDSALADLSYEQIFTENKYFGHDRVNDANLLAIGAATRFLDATTGDERLRLGFAQRYYFESQRVVLNEPLSTAKHSDLVFFGSGRLNSRWLVDGGLQYDPNARHAERLNVSLRYQPEPGKLLQGGYRYLRQMIDAQGLTTQLRQIDLVGQWPISANWSAQGRWNFSLYDHKVLEAVAGLEYNGGCWAFRIVGQRIATATKSATNAVFLQLDLTGLSRIGTNPLEVLRRNIPGYQRSNEQARDTGPASTTPWYQPDY
ncbi:LPS-assembly protein LptD [Burkholderiales bacterium]|nr:LPS-assembly protein LptD [Burkholderiales bacterium]